MKKQVCFIDVHCHIDLCKDIKGLVERARDMDVKIMVCNGINAETNRKALLLAEEYSEIKSALGGYPIDSLKLSDSEIDSEIEFKRKNKENVSAIGEVGLDFKEDSNEHERQKQIFRKFIHLAKELNKPIIVHSRKAEKEVIEILEELKAEKVLMHCFSGKFSLAERIVKNNWFLSMPANIKFSEHFQKVAEKTPIENLLCETDSPYLHPDKLKDNEPALVIESYKKIAEIKKMPLEEVKNKISENYERLFAN